MALSLKKDRSKIKVIAFQDPSVTCEREDYNKYLDSLDETLLQLDPAEAPTYFVLKKSLNVGELQEVKKAMADVHKNQLKLNLGYMLVEVKYALCDIEGGGEGLKYEKDPEGGTDDDLIVLLEEAGILSDLFAARQRATQLKEKSAPKTS